MSVLSGPDPPTGALPHGSGSSAAVEAFGGARGQLPKASHPPRSPPGFVVRALTTYRLARIARAGSHGHQRGRAARDRPIGRRHAAVVGRRSRGPCVDGGGRGGRLDASSILPVPSLNKQGTPSSASVLAQSQSRKEQAAISFFKKQKFKVTATVGQRRALMSAITPALDSSAGPNLIHLRCVAELWRAAIKSARSPPLIDASNRSMKALGELKLGVRIGDFCARVPTMVVTNLAVDCILGTTFLDSHVKAIVPLQRKVLFYHAPSVALTGVTPSRHERKMASRGPSPQLLQEENPADRKCAQFLTNVPSRKIRVVKPVTIPPMTQAMVRVATPVGGLCFLQNHPITAH